jgi:ATP-dependent protease ClpP protease subunit
MAGAPVRMSENATIFIHRIRALAIGELDVMRDTTDFLDKLDDQIACTHGAKAGKPRARFLTVMRGKVDGTSVSAGEAQKPGLVDEVPQHRPI